MTTRPSSPRAIRQTAGKSQIQAAVAASVSEPLVRLYEANRLAIRDLKKLAALDAVYSSYEAAQGGESNEENKAEKEISP